MAVSSELTEMLRALLRGEVDTVAQQAESHDDWNTVAEVIDAAFVLALERKFTPDDDPRDIAAYASKVSAQYKSEGGKALSAVVGDAVMWAALGEDHLRDDIDPKELTLAQMILLHALISEEQLTEPQRDAFLAQATQNAARNLR